MNYDQFVQNMYECTKQKLCENVTLEQQKILKNNGVTVTGFSIRKSNDTIAPIIYLEEYYERFLSGEKIEALSDLLIERQEKIEAPSKWDYRSILDFSKVQDRIVYRLIHQERNSELLKEVPHLPMFDLAIVFYIMIPADGFDSCSVLIRNSHIDLWKLPISILYETARYNTPKLCPYVFRSLMEHLQENYGFAGESPLWVLTNVMGFNGASALLYPQMPKKLYEKLEKPYYLLPSSIHEFLIVEEETPISADHFKEIVQEVNATQVSPEEFLSDSIYYFDGKNITKM